MRLPTPPPPPQRQACSVVRRCVPTPPQPPLRHNVHPADVGNHVGEAHFGQVAGFADTPVSVQQSISDLSCAAPTSAVCGREGPTACAGSGCAISLRADAPTFVPACVLASMNTAQLLQPSAPPYMAVEPAGTAGSVAMHPFLRSGCYSLCRPPNHASQLQSQPTVQVSAQEDLGPDHGRAVSVGQQQQHARSGTNVKNEPPVTPRGAALSRSAVGVKSEHLPTYSGRRSAQLRFPAGGGAGNCPCMSVVSAGHFWYLATGSFAQRFLHFITVGHYSSCGSVDGHSQPGMGITASVGVV